MFGGFEETKQFASFFTASKSMADKYAENRMLAFGYPTKQIYPCFIRIVNPLDTTVVNQKLVRTLLKAGVNLRSWFGLKDVPCNISDISYVIKSYKSVIKRATETEETKLYWKKRYNNAMRELKPYLSWDNYAIETDVLWKITEMRGVVDKLVEMGYDGLIVDETYSAQREFKIVDLDAELSYAVFTPHQVKSLYNMGEFHVGKSGMYESKLKESPDALFGGIVDWRHPNAKAFGTQIDPVTKEKKFILSNRTHQNLSINRALDKTCGRL
jgi:hypothetical protein